VLTDIFDDCDEVNTVQHRLRDLSRRSISQSINIRLLVACQNADREHFRKIQMMQYNTMLFKYYMDDIAQNSEREKTRPNR